MTLPQAHFEPEFAPLELLPILLPALLYWWRAQHLAQRGRPVPPWRQVSFAAGLLIIALSLIGLGEISDELLWGHMVEHLLIGDLAAIFLVLGLTGPLLQPILAIKPLDRLRSLAHPAIALPLLGDRPLRLAHPHAVRGDAVPPTAPCPRARDVHLLRLRDVDARPGPAAHPDLGSTPAGRSCT